MLREYKRDLEDQLEGAGNTDAYDKAKAESERAKQAALEAERKKKEEEEEKAAADSAKKKQMMQSTFTFLFFLVRIILPIRDSTYPFADAAIRLALGKI